MEEFKKFMPLDTETQTSDFYVDASGKGWPIYRKRLTAAAGKFANAGANTIAHGIAALKLDGPFNVPRVNCSNGTITADKTKISFSADVTNVNTLTTTDLHLYSGEVDIEYCKTTD